MCYRFSTPGDCHGVPGDPEPGSNLRVSLQGPGRGCNSCWDPRCRAHGHVWRRVRVHGCKWGATFEGGGKRCSEPSYAPICDATMLGTGTEQMMGGRDSSASWHHLDAVSYVSFPGYDCDCSCPSADLSYAVRGGGGFLGGVPNAPSDALYTPASGAVGPARAGTAQVLPPHRGQLRSTATVTALACHILPVTCYLSHVTCYLNRIRASDA